MKKMLDNEIEQEIINLAEKYNLEEVILFGSRADGTAHEKVRYRYSCKGVSFRYRKI